MTIYKITQQDGHEFSIDTEHYGGLGIDPMIEKYKDDDEFEVENISDSDSKNT